MLHKNTGQNIQRMGEIDSTKTEMKHAQSLLGILSNWGPYSQKETLANS